MSSSKPQVRVSSLYQFTRFEDIAAIQQMLRLACAQHAVRGTVILAPEGINGTIAGSVEAVDQVIALIRSLPGCAHMPVKDSLSADLPFHRMKVRIKREIVTMGEPGISPLHGVGDYVAPEDWNALIQDPDVILIDTRNHYETRVGTFRNAIDPGTARFRDFPAWFRERRVALTGDKAPKVAMFCTGGIRCEKATALLKAEGVEQVYHLQGGILKYLEEVPAQDSLWEGECFVFDQRVCLTHGLEDGSYEICHACRMPVAEGDRASPHYRAGVSCPGCHGARSPDQRARYAERQRQARLAQARGVRHIGRCHEDK